jgi:hypothetical protein
MACTVAVSFFQDPALDHKSNTHTNLIRIWFFGPLKLQKGCALDSRIYGILLVKQFASVLYLLQKYKSIKKLHHIPAIGLYS